MTTTCMLSWVSSQAQALQGGLGSASAGLTCKWPRRCSAHLSPTGSASSTWTRTSTSACSCTATGRAAERPRSRLCRGWLLRIRMAVSCSPTPRPPAPAARCWKPDAWLGRASSPARHRSPRAAVTAATRRPTWRCQAMTAWTCSLTPSWPARPTAARSRTAGDDRLGSAWWMPGNARLETGSTAHELEPYEQTSATCTSQGGFGRILT